MRKSLARLLRHLADRLDRAPEIRIRVLDPSEAWKITSQRGWVDMQDRLREEIRRATR